LSGIEQRHHRLEQLGDQWDQRRGHPQHDADRNAEREPTERGAKGCLKMRPDAAVGEQIVERRANLAWRRQIKRIEHAGAACRLPQREQHYQGGCLASPGKVRSASHQAASAR
jgi:hypothetical protein